MRAQDHITLERPLRSMDPEPRFEVIFGIPVAHSLLATRSRSRGGQVSSVWWEHEEYDGRSALVARYESFTQCDATGVRASGWRKYDGDGHITEEAQWLG